MKARQPIRIVIFAKAPQPGLAKTRLIPALGAQGAADLARRMLQHTLKQALAADIGVVELCVTPASTHDVWQTIPVPPQVAWSEQGEGDLGMRMARAARRVTDAGESILLIGSDCPALNATKLCSTAAVLQHYDAVITPAFDGGYVLLGLHRFDFSLFENIAWSTDSVAAETLRRLNHLDWTVQTQPTLHDIDESDDLNWLPAAWLA